jgi:pimeloyl-ACP methyl ester carboxylesterase
MKQVHRAGTGLQTSWIVPFGLILALSGAGCYTPGPIGSASRPNVVVLRGPAGYFPGLMAFEDKLLDEGVCTTVAYPDAYPKIAERLIAGRNLGRLQGPVVIVGYSSGAGAAMLLSRRLGERGIDVDKLVLLEAADSMRVPGNVHQCFNVYKSQPWSEVKPIFRGDPLAVESPATMLVNYDLREYNDGRFDWDGHLTLTANPYVQDLVIDEILTAFDETEEVPVEQGPVEMLPGEMPPGEGGESMKMSRAADLPAAAGKLEPTPIPGSQLRPVINGTSH